MKTIGLLGGMSWESTLGYYRDINQGVKKALGGLHSARIVLNSVDFHEIEVLQRAGDWDAAGRYLARTAQAIQAGGADFLLICTNTMHRVADAVESAVDIPLLHIADATAARLKADGIERVGLLGTRFTMEQDFYAGRMARQFGLEVLVPPETGRERIHRIIFEELCMGVQASDSRQAFLDIINDLGARGAQAVILGCTEIGMLVQQAHTDMPLYDTAVIHAERAVEMALAGQGAWVA
jgi:aspartate racemase